MVEQEKRKKGVKVEEIKCDNKKLQEMDLSVNLGEFNRKNVIWDKHNGNYEGEVVVADLVIKGFLLESTKWC